MLERMRYVTRRVNRSGKERWYWQRPGHKLTRLPEDAVARFSAQAKLNAAADGANSPRAPGSVAWVVTTYKASDRYKDLRPGTRKYYDRFLADIEKIGGANPFGQFDRKAVIDLIETYEKVHQRRQVAVVLKNLVHVARYHGLIAGDPTTDLRLKTGRPRQRVWSAEEVAAWLTVETAPHMVTAFLLLQYTAQRPGDVLAMTWAQYDGRGIKLRQEKTGAFVEVPCHPDLKFHLDGLKRTGLMLVSYRGRPVKYIRFNERFRHTCLRAKVDAQARDLRRTAMVRMAEAGATVPQLAAVSGHSIDQTQRILETYLPRNREMAQAAITRLAEHKPGAKV